MKLHALLTTITFSLSISLVAQWTQSNGPYGGNAQELIWLEPTLLVSVGNGGIYASDDLGERWIVANNGLPENASIWDLKSNEGKLYASVYGDGLYISLDTGTTWSPINTGIENMTFYNIGVDASDIYAGNANGGIYHSADGGETWVNKSSGIEDIQFQDFTFFNSKIYAGGTALYSSTNDSDVWEEVEISGLGLSEIRSLTSTEDFIYAGTDGQIFISSDGIDWTKSTLNVGGTITSLGVSGDSVYLTTGNGVIYSSNDHWATWEIIQNNATDRFVKSAFFSEDKTIMTTSEGIFVSSDHENWTESNEGISGLQITSLGIIGCYTYAGTSSNGLYFVTEDNSWTRLVEGLEEISSQGISDIQIIQDSVFIVAGGSIYGSYDGSPWELLFEPGINKAVQNISFDEGVFMASVNGDGVYVSMDTAKTWELSVQVGLNTETSYYDLEIYGDTVLISTHDGEMFVSENLGENWEEISLEGDFYLTYDLALHDDNLYAGTTKGLLVSEDLGTNWQFFNNTSMSIYTLQFVGSKIYAGSNGVFEIDLTGGEWVDVSESLGYQPVKSLAFIDNKVFAGTFANSVWQRPIEEFNVAPEIVDQLNPITGIEDASFEVEDSDFLVTDGNLCQDSVTVLPVAGDHYTVSGKIVTPNPDFSGTLKVNVVANDGITNSDSYEVEVEISPTNDIPVIIGHSDLSTPPNTSLEISLNDIEVSNIDGTYPDDFTLTIHESEEYAIAGNSITPNEDISDVLSVHVSVNDGEDESEVYELAVSIESILNIDKASEQIIYPNPFQTSFTLNMKGDDDVEIRIFNLSGSEMLYLKQPANHTIDGALLPKGVYVVEVSKEGNKILSRRIIKE